MNAQDVLSALSARIFKTFLPVLLVGFLVGCSDYQGGETRGTSFEKSEKVSGQILNENGTPLVSAQVLAETDLGVINETVSDVSGAFDLKVTGYDQPIFLLTVVSNDGKQGSEILDISAQGNQVNLILGDSTLVIDSNPGPIASAPQDPALSGTSTKVTTKGESLVDDTQSKTGASSGKKGIKGSSDEKSDSSPDSQNSPSPSVDNDDNSKSTPNIGADLKADDAAAVYEKEEAGEVSEGPAIADKYNIVPYNYPYGEEDPEVSDDGSEDALEVDEQGANGPNSGTHKSTGGKSSGGLF
ncbi:MAG: hypothetical protein KDD53_02745 [Bdellovibrionales bacterium]|nr:hypothetical protein [Bdellovibrionales bacterium]